MALCECSLDGLDLLGQFDESASSKHTWAPRRKLKWTMPELDARKQTILQAVIFEYVSSADPVGSELLVQKYGLGVKAATVRNELADLADMGYLEQPHTSAGRIPSDLGYRYYVDRLIVKQEPESVAK